MPNGREDTTIKDMLINGQIRERSVRVLDRTALNSVLCLASKQTNLLNRRTLT